MRVKTLMAFGPYSKGQVIEDAPDNWARQMITMNRVIEVKAEAVRSPLNRMVESAVTRRTGRRG